MFTSKLLPDLTPVLFHAKLCAKHGTSLQQYRFVRAGQIAIKSINRGNKRIEDRKEKKSSMPLTPIMKANKGVGRQMAMLSELPGSDEYHEDSDYILNSAVEDLEDDKDYFKINQDYAELKREIEQRRRNVSYQTIKRKFFKPPKQPNFLTFAEKEHIRFLSEDPQSKWSAETLADSYPATPEIIKKICKAKWKPLNVQEILRHDTAVKRNWEDFKKGKLTISDDLRERLKLFPNRTLSVPLLSEAEKFIQKPAKKPKKIDEFIKIIESHRKFQEMSPTGSTRAIESAAEGNDIDVKEIPTFRESKTDSFENQFVSSDSTEQNFITENEPTNRRARHFTFDEFRKNLENESKREEVDLEDRRIINSRVKNISNSIPHKKSKKTLEEETSEEDIVIFDKPNTAREKSTVKNSLSPNVRANLSSKSENSVRIPQETEPKDVPTVSFNPSFLSEVTSVIRKDKELVLKDTEKYLEAELAIKEFIRIPKDLRKKDCLYKVNDCFYTDDGEFLYRVPGLKS